MGDFRNLTPGDHPEVQAFLRHPAELHLYLRTRIDRPAGGRGLVCREGGRILGFAWLGGGRNLVFAGDDPGFLHALAGLARRQESRWILVVAPHGPCTDFLARYARLTRRTARLDRSQTWYRLTPDRLSGLAEPALRPATLADLPDLVPAAARMSAEDFDMDFDRIDLEAVRGNMERKVREGRSWVYRERGEFAFKVDLAVRHPLGGQVEGVFTPEDRRGRGIASRCIAELGRRLLGELRCLGLHVDAANAPAIRAYERAGFRREAELRLAIFVT